MNLVCPTCRSVQDGRVESHALDADFTCSGCGMNWPFLQIGAVRIPVLLTSVLDRTAALDSAREFLKRLEEGPAAIAQPAAGWLAEALQQAATYVPAHWGHFAQPPLPAADLTWIDDWLPADADLPQGPLLALGSGPGGELPHMVRGQRAIVALDSHLPLLAFAAAAADQASFAMPYRPAAEELSTRPLTLPAAARQALSTVRPCCANALDPPFQAESFAAIVMCNVIDSVPDPVTLLGQCEALLKPGGALLLSSPYHWQEAVTPHDRRPQRLWPEGVDIRVGMEALLTGQVLPGFLDSLSLQRSEPALPWQMTLHPGVAVRYAMHVVLLRKNLE